MNDLLKPKLKLVEADLTKDKEDIISFWTENFPGWQPSKFEMFYTGGLYGPGVVWNFREPADNKIIGTHCYFPRQMHIQGKDYMGSISSDLAVLRKYNKFGFATDLMVAVLNSIEKYNIDFIYGHPNRRSENVFINAGYDTIGRTSRTVKIFKYNTYIKKIVKSSLIANIIASPINYITKIFSDEIKNPANSNISYEILDHFDNRFDKLWEDAKNQYTIIGERTARWLNWRYIDCPNKIYNIFAVIDKSDHSIIGYYVYQIRDKNVLIIDFFGKDLQDNTGIMIDTFLKYQRTQPIDIITFYFFGNRNIIDKFIKKGFVLRKDHRFLKVYARKNSPIKNILLNENNWHYLDGDNDVEP